jgi:hypothetical protein
MAVPVAVPVAVAIYSWVWIADLVIPAAFAAYIFD